MWVTFVMLEIVVCVIDANEKCRNFQVQSNGTKIENRLDSMLKLKNVSLEFCCHKCKDKDDCRSLTYENSARLCHFYQQNKPPHIQTCTSCVYYASFKTSNTSANPKSNKKNTKESPTLAKGGNGKLAAIIFVSLTFLLLIVTLCYVFYKRRKVSSGAKPGIPQNDRKFDGKNLVSFDQKVVAMNSVAGDLKGTESDTLHDIADIEVKSFVVDETRAAKDVVQPSKSDVISDVTLDEHTMQSDASLQTATR